MNAQSIDPDELIRWPTKLGEQNVKVALVVEGQTQHVLGHIAEIGEIRNVQGV